MKAPASGAARAAAQSPLWEGSANPADYGKAAGRAFRLDAIVYADFSAIEDLKASIILSNGVRLDLFDIDALELAYAVKPSAVEGKRLRYARGSWMVHNLLGHPLMQVLALFKLYRWAFWVHDKTAPRARGSRRRS